jgi:hypothetical protein
MRRSLNENRPNKKENKMNQKLMIKNLQRDVDAFTRAYIECALWSSTDDGEPMDKRFNWLDLSDETLSKMIEDCAKFQAQQADSLGKSGLASSRAGHDFWLNRNGHGSGFWDEDAQDKDQEDAFIELSKASKAFRECDLYVGDDGKLYI